MRKLRFPYLSLINPFVFILFLSISCNSSDHNQKAISENNVGEMATPSITSLDKPEKGSVYTCGDEIKFNINLTDTSAKIDSIRYFDGPRYLFSTSGKILKTGWKSDNVKVGQNTFRIVIYYNDSLTESHATQITFLSDIKPAKYSYQVIHKYPHDPDAYTQGLVYEGGYLYEGTGQPGKSSLRKVNISTGIPIEKVNLENKFFGEGITIYKDNIYQITWKSQVGFVYNKSTLEQIREFDYPIHEGWGLTTDGARLIMSDGSSHLYFIDPEFFTQTGQLEVFDNKGMVSQLNELEYINGKVFANVYGDTRIVIIDPATGKVTGSIECKDLMPKGVPKDMDHVLNGIAYNPATGNLYLTGKYWPVLYEVKLVPPEK